MVPWTGPAPLLLLRGRVVFCPSRLVKIGPVYPPSPNPSHQGRGILRMPFIPALPGGAFWHNFVKL